MMQDSALFPETPASRQAKKYSLGMAGEMFVAAQLQRLGVTASVTYGNAKRADVVCIALDGLRAVVLEVKTSDKGRWPIGQRVPAPSTQLWVFVHLPSARNDPPRYFIWTQEEMHVALRPAEAAYMESYKLRRGEDYGERPGVAAMRLREAAIHEDAWHKVLSRLALPDSKAF